MIRILLLSAYLFIPSAAFADTPLPLELPQLSSDGSKLVRQADLIEQRFTDRLTGRYVTGEQAMIVFIELSEGDAVPWHSHEAEQLTSVLSGRLHFFIGTDEREFIVAAGETIVIPANVPHRATALEPTKEIDVFSPIRREWME